MIIYSTCRSCGGLLHVTGTEKTHPNCPPKLSKVERLGEDWLTAALAEDNDIADGIEQLINQLDDKPPRLLDAALLYASWGWPVFPLKTSAMAQNARDPLKAAKTPATRNGFKDATLDPDRITAWWTRHPDSGIGLPTGDIFDVIDIDTPDGIPTYLELLKANKIVHGQVATASAGIHLYIAPTGHQNKVRWKPGTDYRGAGGYVIAPPTRLLNNRRHSYSWTHRPSPFITGQGDTYGVVA